MGDEPVLPEAERAKVLELFREPVLPESERAEVLGLFRELFTTLVDDYSQQARDHVQACLAKGIPLKVATAIVGLSMSAAGTKIAGMTAETV